VHTVLQAVVVLGCVAAGLRWRPAGGLLLLAAVVVLLPAGLHLPTGVTPLLSATRLTALAVAVQLLRRRPAPGLFASTPLHRAAWAYGVAALVAGVLLAGPELPAGDTVPKWLDLLDPLLVGVVALACARAAGARATVQALSAVALVAVAAGVLEHGTGRSLADLLVPGPGLEQRAGESRVRVGSDFALAFAWTLAALTPAVVVRFRHRPLLLFLALAALLLVTGWTFTRSVPLALALGLVLVLLGLRDRRVTATLLAVAAVVAVVAMLSPALRDRYSAAIDQGAVDVRSERAPVALESAARHPVAGLGLTGLARLEIGEVDNSYLLTYTETGVLGAVTLVVVLGGGLVLVGRGLRGPPSTARAAAAAALGGAAVLVCAGAVFDAFAVRGTAGLLGLLLGTGLAAAEQVAGPAPHARPTRDLPRLRVAAVLLALAGGLAVSAWWPRHVALTVSFQTLSTSDLAEGYDQVDQGRRLIDTVCGVARTVRHPDVRLDCVDANTAAGVGRIRAEAPSAREAADAVFALVLTARATTVVRDLTVTLTVPPRGAADTLLATAPWSATLAVLLLAWLVPSEPLRRFEAGSRRWAWSVDRQDVGPGPGGEPRAPLGGAQQVGERPAEAGDVADREPVGGHPLRP
jgi:hypothetical protein